MWIDLFTALEILPWLIVLGFFTFIFLEWSAKRKGEENLHARLFGEGNMHPSDESVFRSRADDEVG